MIPKNTRYFFASIAQLAVLTACLIGAAPHAVAGDYDAEYTSKTKFGLYKVRTASRDDNRVRLVISRNGRTLLDKTDDHYFVLDPTSKDPDLSYAGKTIPLQDLCGNGAEDVVIETWSGGAHCCYTINVYILGKTLKHLWRIDLGDGHLLGIKKSHHKQPYLRIEDSTFRYFQTNVFDMPVVILRWQNGKFRVDRARMKTGLDKHPQHDLNEVKAELERGSQSTFTGYILNLYYCGKAKEANKVIDELLPLKSEKPTIDSRGDYRKAFLNQLKKSPFYADIKAINDGHL